MPAAKPKLTPRGKDLIKNPDNLPLGDLLSWPWLESRHPDILQIPVCPATPDHRWTRAATIARFENGAFHPRTRIVYFPSRKKYPNQRDILISLCHEICHLIQVKDGRWAGDDLHHATPGYRNNPLEKQAKAFAKRWTSTT